MPVGRPRRARGGVALETPGTSRRTRHSPPDSPNSDEEMMEEAEPSSEISMPEAAADSDSDYEDQGRGRGRGKRQKLGEPALSTIKKAPKKTPMRKKGPELDTEGSLFEIVKSGKTALTTVVDEWIEAYKADRDSALLDLIQFFIHSSGCRGRITPQMYASMEHSEIIRKMTEEFDEESGDYPLIMAGPQWKKFKNNFCEFIMVLVRQCQYSIIYDQYMMDNVISLLTGLTDSQVRAFRHTSTLASMKLMTALVDVALNLSINLDHTQRQYEAERQKNRNKQASERLEMLMTKRTEIEENQEEIRNMLTYIFKGVFVHRYRDTQPEIRSICMSEIGLWMKRYPSMFLDDSYLKYVGWTLYDRVGEVRLCCLRCLQPMYETDELSPRLELFTNRFKERIVDMTLDKEYDVAVAAVKLVSSVLRFSDNVLSDKDAENVYELVYSSHRAVAQAAGEFLNQKLFSRELDEVTRNLKTRKGKKRSENTPLIRDLVQFFIESELHEHGAYLVDSLWEINDMLKDWECMTDLLLEEPGRGEEPMDDRQETSLIEIMVCCVRQAATGEYPVGRGPTRRLTSKESKQVSEDKTKLTEHFIITLPQLLAKFNMDSEKVANLLQIPSYFAVDIYTSSRLEKHLDSLLRHISDIVDKHTDSEVLENCSKVLESFCSEEYAISGKCNVAKSTLIDQLVEKYREAFQDFFQEGEDPDDDDAYALMASLKRIYAFYSCHDLNQWNLWDSLFSIVRGGLEGNHIPEEIVNKAMACCSNALLWFLHELEETSPDQEKMKALKKRLHNFMTVCHELLYHQQDKVQDEAYVTICDLLIVYSKQLASNAPMVPLIYEPSKSLQINLGGFLNEKVFIDDEDDDMDENQKIEELHKRRNFLASFCKLVVYNVISIRNAADMFKHYMKFYNDYGDIIKATLGKSREINKVTTARTLALSLTSLFKELQSEQGHNIDRGSEGFQAMKELARRFSLSFGLDQVKNREAVAAMHKEGIQFSVNPLENPMDPNGPPPNLSFLEVLSEFTSKLMRQDKKVVLSYLDKHLGVIPPGQGELWAPLLTYRNALMQGDLTDISMIPPARTTGKGRGKGKRKAVQESVLDDTTHQWRGGRTPANPQVYPLTSTAVKRRRVDDQGSDHTESPQGSDAGSERDYETSVQKRRKLRDLNSSYTRRRSSRPTSRLSNIPLPTLEELSQDEDEASIEEFASPQSVKSQNRKSTPRPQATRGTRRSLRACTHVLTGMYEESPTISQYSEELIDA